MRCAWIIINGRRYCYASRIPRCFTRRGCDRQALVDKPLLLLLPDDEVGFGPELADPTAQINEILDATADANLDPGRELALVIVEDEDGDDRVALSWVHLADIVSPPE